MLELAGTYFLFLKLYFQFNRVTSRVNPVNTIYAAFPALLYVNASIVPYLLGPLLDYQSTSAYTNAFAAPDLGMFERPSDFLWDGIKLRDPRYDLPNSIGEQYKYNFGCHRK